MKIREITAFLESFAPLKYQEDYDNCGMITGDPTAFCTGVLVTLDCTENVVNEAIQKKLNLIVAHHPLIFKPIRDINSMDEIGKVIIAAIRAGIAVYAIHTNLDNLRGGVNSRIADKVGLTNSEILSPHPVWPETGAGLWGQLDQSVPEQDFLKMLKRQFGTPVIRHTPLRGLAVSTVALCGGAGSFMIAKALSKGVDAFVTADLKYHDFFQANGKLVIFDIGHYESEQFTIDLLYDVILKKFPNFAVLKSGTETNPVHYYI